MTRLSSLQLFSGLVFTVVILFHFIKPCPFLWANQEQPFVVWFSVVSLYLVATFLVASSSDPGTVTREPVRPEVHPLSSRKVTINGVEVYEIWCHTCWLYRSPRGSHCRVCDRCVKVFDHHCKWVNNCIGAQNYCYFLHFLTALFLHSVNSIALVSVYAVKLHAAGGVFEPLDWVFTAIAAALHVVNLLNVSKLIWNHVSLIRRGLTSHEELRSKYVNSKNPFDAGWKRNFMEACSYRPSDPFGTEGTVGTKDTVDTVEMEDEPPAVDFNSSTQMMPLTGSLESGRGVKKSWADTKV